MSYQVLARKWRPQCYTDVVGQRHALAVLTYSCTHHRLHHAYLFSGSRGVGKTTLARLLAKGLNCEAGITATPCRQCAPCQEIEQGRFVDLLEIDAASRTTLEDTRELLDNVHYAPVSGRFRIYLIDEVHMLSRHSFNALLKTLEEPPPHVKFLLATTDPQKLPQTLLSRCLQLHLQLLSVEQIEEQLQKIVQAEEIDAELPALKLLAEAAQGSLRDALTLMDQALALGAGSLSTAVVSQLLGTLDTQQALSLVEALQQADTMHLLQQVDHCLSQGVEADQLLAAMAMVLHQIALQQWLPQTPGELDPQAQRLRQLAQRIDPMDLQLYYQTLLLGRKELPLAPNPRMGVEMTLLRAMVFYPNTDPTSKLATRCLPTADPRSIDKGDNPSLTTRLGTIEVQKADAVLSGADKMPLTRQVSESLESPLAECSFPSSETTQLTAIYQQLQIQRQQQRASIIPESADQVVDNTLIIKGFSPVKRRCSAMETQSASAASAGQPLSRLAVEAAKRDSWSAEVARLQLPKRLEQLALHCVCEQPNPSDFRLYFRSAYRHLNRPEAAKQLAKALSASRGHPVTVTVQLSDDIQQRTPVEWQQLIAEEQQQAACQALQVDEHLQRFQSEFDAKIDESSIQPASESL